MSACGKEQSKNGMRRFSIASSTWGGSTYIAADLDEGVVRVWESRELTKIFGYDGFSKTKTNLLFSNDRSERNLYYGLRQRDFENSENFLNYCFGVKLRESQIEALESILSYDAMLFMLSNDRETLFRHEGLVCDGGHEDWYAESDSGLPPVSFRDISPNKAVGNPNLPLAHARNYLRNQVLAGCYLASGSPLKRFDVRSETACQKICESINELTFFDVLRILRSGSKRLIRALAQELWPNPLNFQYDEGSFQVTYGDFAFFAPLVAKKPICATVLGESFVFSHRQETPHE